MPLNAVVDDIATFDMGKEKYDLIALMYVGGRGLADRVRAALKPGAVVVVEYFHKEMEAQFNHPMGAFDTGELAQLFSGMEVVKDEVVEDVADFGLQKAKVVRFVAMKK